MITPASALADPWVVEATPEQADAVSLGAEQVEAAQTLAKQQKYADAVALLEQVVQDHPASVHDCNLALAYLRSGDLTRAQLLLDVAKLRGGARPDWCTSSLPSKLAQGLRDQEYVPLTVTTTPADAVIEVAGLTVRGVHLFWLPVATYKVVVHAEGYDDAKAPVVVAAPGAEVELTLNVPTAKIDRPPVDDPVDTSGGLGAVDLGDVAPPPRMLPPPPQTPTWPGWAGVAGGGAFLALGAGFHIAALGTKDDANALPRDSAMFDSLSSSFSRERGLAVAGYAIGAAAIGFGIWWLTQRAGEHR